ncbi:hypothetical protein ARMGADRAFT_560303 [Armillaria gallica]|uniref:Uncharacterized protein n=1 Tax=Armillaria gallica TaxID=47427 RepID=A0A2H3DDP6_ARMGA|nr:hypothetical protein ARMGADRAFT_560303 [Armillaria gallica]
MLMAPISGQVLSIGRLVKELLVRDGGVSLWGDGERDLCLNELFGMSRNVFNCRTGSDKGT